MITCGFCLPRKSGRFYWGEISVYSAANSPLCRYYSSSYIKSHEFGSLFELVPITRRYLESFPHATYFKTVPQATWRTVVWLTGYLLIPSNDYQLDAGFYSCLSLLQNACLRVIVYSLSAKKHEWSCLTRPSLNIK